MNTVTWLPRKAGCAVPPSSMGAHTLRCTLLSVLPNASILANLTECETARSVFMNEVEHLSTCVRTISISSSVNCLFISFAHFLNIGLLVWWSLLSPYAATVCLWCLEVFSMFYLISILFCSQYIFGNFLLSIFLRLKNSECIFSSKKRFLSCNYILLTRVFIPSPPPPSQLSLIFPISSPSTGGTWLFNDMPSLELLNSF